MKRNPKLFRLFLQIAIVCVISQTACGEEVLKAGQLRVISYNVQFLPGPASIANKRPQPEYRAQTIGQKITEYDIIGLNELFDEKPKQMLLAEVEKAWGDQANVIVSPKVQADRFTGGLAIISRLPFLETNVHTYTQSSSPEKYGFAADGFATKGILHARIALSSAQSIEASVDVFVTHMEAREPAIRPSQYKEFADFVRQHASPQRSAILMGDFNTRGGDAEMQNLDSDYHLMVGRFREAQPQCTLIDLWPSIGRGYGGTSDQIKEDGGRRIDYIFVMNPKTAAPALEPKEVLVNRFLDPNVVALSDHSAVEAILQWTKP